MNYCSECGNTVERKVPEGDHRERDVCPSCGAIHYQNPRAVVGTIPIYEGKVLLCKRAIEPRLGFWTLPAGFLENGETTEQGALRETWEESCANVTSYGLYRIFNVVHANQIHMFFRASLPDLSFSVTPESSEVQLFEFSEIPWSEIAFPTVHKTLVDYMKDSKSQDFSMQLLDIGNEYWQHMRAP